MIADQARLDFLKRDAVQGFMAHCGLEPVSLTPGLCITRIKLKEHHLQQDGFAHAGIIASMADHTAGYASFSLVPSDRRILTIEYKINFLKPASGEYLECRARVVKPGRQILVAESEVFAVSGQNEELAAKALLTMAAVPEDKVPGPKKTGVVKSIDPV